MTLKLDHFRQLLTLKQMAKVRVTTDSMKPLIKPGEILTVVPIQAKLNRFDIIIFDYYGNPFCHFLWGKVFNKEQNIESYFTRSLKNPSVKDIPISENDILGIVTNKKINLLYKIKIYFILIFKH